MQRHLSVSRVVKAFGNIAFMSLATSARPTGTTDRSALPVAGDAASAKDAVIDLLDALGYDAVDTGSLADSWRFEPGTPMYVQPYLPGHLPEDLAPEDFPRWVMEQPVTPVTVDDVHALVASANPMERIAERVAKEPGWTTTRIGTGHNMMMDDPRYVADILLESGSVD